MKDQIAVDGPAGAGKSTIAKRIAKELGFIYVDTGAMYRTTALYLLKSGLSKEALFVPDNPEVKQRLLGLLGEMKLQMKNEAGIQKIFLDGQDVSSEIRTQEIGALASVVSQYTEVRNYLTVLQKEIGRLENVVMDGRDIGTEVLPHATLKIYLTASSRTRAERRWKELAEKGDTSHSLDEIQAEIEKRDSQDMNREISPLKKAEDAVFLDSSALDIEEVTKKILDCFDQKKAKQC